MSGREDARGVCDGWRWGSGVVEVHLDRLNVAPHGGRNFASTSQLSLTLSAQPPLLAGADPGTAYVDQLQGLIVAQRGYAASSAQSAVPRPHSCRGQSGCA